MADTLLTADTHYGHYNTIRYCGRPFSSIEEMNEYQVNGYNSVVKSEDTVYINGDFCFHNSKDGKNGEGQLAKFNHWDKQLNGNKIYIKGNHDSNNGVKSKIERVVIKHAKMRIGIVHKPFEVIIEDDSFYYPLHFTGHVHEKWLTKEKVNKNNKIALLINVGVDMWNFKPVNIQKLITIYYRWLNKHERKEDILYWNKQSNNRKKIYE